MGRESLTASIHTQALRQEQLELMERERLLKVHQNTLQEQRLAMILSATRRQEEERKEDLLAKFELEEENVQRVRSPRFEALRCLHFLVMISRCRGSFLFRF